MIHTTRQIVCDTCRSAGPAGSSAMHLREKARAEGWRCDKNGDTCELCLMRGKQPSAAPMPALEALMERARRGEFQTLPED